MGPPGLAGASDATLESLEQLNLDSCEQQKVVKQDCSSSGPSDCQQEMSDILNLIRAIQRQRQEHLETDIPL